MDEIDFKKKMEICDILYEFTISGDEIKRNVINALEKRIEVIKFMSKIDQNSYDLDGLIYMKNLKHYILDYKLSEEDYKFDILGYFMSLLAFSQCPKKRNLMIRGEGNLLTYRLQKNGFGKSVLEKYPIISYVNKNNCTHVSNFINCHEAVVKGDAKMSQGMVTIESKKLIEVLVRQQMNVTNERMNKINFNLSNDYVKHIFATSIRYHIFSKYIYSTMEEDELGEFLRQNIPPCMENLMNLGNKRKLEHRERIVLFFFFRDIKMDIEKAMDIFMNMYENCDYEKKIDYYEKNIEGIFNVKEYKSFSCKNLQTDGLCVSNRYKCSQKCKGYISNPGTFYRKMMRNTKHEENDPIIDIEDLL